MLWVKSLLENLITKFGDRSAFYGYIKIKIKRQKRQIQKKKLSEKIVEAIKNCSTVFFFQHLDSPL